MDYCHNQPMPLKLPPCKDGNEYRDTQPDMKSVRELRPLRLKRDLSVKYIPSELENTARRSSRKTFGASEDGTDQGNKAP